MRHKGAFGASFWVLCCIYTVSQPEERSEELEGLNVKCAVPGAAFLTFQCPPGATLVLKEKLHLPVARGRWDQT